MSYLVLFATASFGNPVEDVVPLASNQPSHLSPESMSIVSQLIERRSFAENGNQRTSMVLTAIAVPGLA